MDACDGRHSRGERHSRRCVRQIRAVPMKTLIRATVTFNRRKQDAGEKFDNFVTDLRVLVKDWLRRRKPHAARRDCATIIARCCARQMSREG